MLDQLPRNKQGLTEPEFLAAYDASKFERPSVTVDMLLFTVADTFKESYRKLPDKQLQLLLIKRGDHPFIRQWALPGGFVNPDESLDEAALRELKEETNVEFVYLEQLYTWGDLGRDPRTRIVSVSYLSLVDRHSLNIQADDDADDARWFGVDCSLMHEQKTMLAQGYCHEQLYHLSLTSDQETLSARIRVVKTVSGKVTKIERQILESDGLAFDHAQIILYGIERLRSKIEYTEVAFNLMPDLFTLTQLQQVYEVILGVDLLKANFRRKIAGMVLETNGYTKDAGHRPSKLFRFNPDWQKPGFGR